MEPSVKAVTAPSVEKLKGRKTAPAVVSVPTSPRLEKCLALMAEALPSLDQLMQDPSGLAALAALAGGGSKKRVLGHSLTKGALELLPLGALEAALAVNKMLSQVTQALPTLESLIEDPTRLGRFIDQAGPVLGKLVVAYAPESLAKHGSQWMGLVRNGGWNKGWSPVFRPELFKNYLAANGENLVERLGSYGLTRADITGIKGATYDINGRSESTPGIVVNLAWDKEGTLIKNEANPATTTNLQFDGLNRPILQTRTTTEGQVNRKPHPSSPTARTAVWPRKQTA
ncbi:MAG: hypothetical protein IPP35_09515 [Elusimicrobia bacterium]|nr:hypothetical protein [Elusimicrobiota bacterium]